MPAVALSRVGARVVESGPGGEDLPAGAFIAELSQRAPLEGGNTAGLRRVPGLPRFVRHVSNGTESYC